LSALDPGKTQTINHYEMVTGDGTWYLVDLPGYGFANAPDDKKKQWALFTREYLLEREVGRCRLSDQNPS